jgi:hypothetical protein
VPKAASSSRDGALRAALAAAAEEHGRLWFAAQVVLAKRKAAARR